MLGAPLLVGTATVTGGPTVLVSGTATVDFSASTEILSGTATVATAAVRPWLGSASSRRRGNCARVLLGPDLEDMSGFFESVTITRELMRADGNPVPTATFQIVDERVAFFNAFSLAAGGVPCVVVCYSEDDLGGQEYVRFRGYTRAVQNEDPYIPRATFTAIGITGWYAQKGANTGCLSVAPFAGLTPLDVIQDYVESAGGVLTIPIGTGEKLNRGIALSGLAPLEVIRKYGPLEGAYTRDNDGVLEILTEAQVISGPARLSFVATDATLPTNIFGLKEIPPDGPTTEYVISGLGIDTGSLLNPAYTVQESAKGGVDASGDRWDTITRTYMRGGIEIRTTVEEYKTYAPIGETVNPKRYQLVRRTTSVTNWEYANVTIQYRDAQGNLVGGTVVSAPTGRVLSATVDVESMFGVPCSKTATGAKLWTDGSYRTVNDERLMLTSHTDTTFTWDSTTCVQTQKTDITKSYYAPQGDAGASYEYTGKESSWRSTINYGWIITEKVTETWSDNDGSSAPYQSDHAVTTETYHVTGSWDDSGTPRPVETFGLSDFQGETFRSLGGDRYSAMIVGSNDQGSTYDQKTLKGATPEPTRRSGGVPQYADAPFTMRVTASSNRYPTISVPVSMLEAETTTQAERAGRYLLRDQMAVRHAVESDVMPLLLPGDRAASYDPTRNLNGLVEVVEKVSETWYLATGRCSANYVLAYYPPELC